MFLPTIPQFQLACVNLENLNCLLKNSLLHSIWRTVLWATEWAPIEVIESVSFSERCSPFCY